MYFDIDMCYTQKQYNIMRTSFLTAFPKVFTDIKYAANIFNEIVNLSFEKGFKFESELFVSNLAIEIEGRHKALNNILIKEISKCKIKPVIIELGAGMSPRRLEFYDMDYFEVDYPPVIEIKKNIYTSFGFSKLNKNLIGMDITNNENFEMLLELIINNYPERELIFLSEGLFWYVSMHDIKCIAENIKKASKKTNTIWITGDCPVQDDKMKYLPYRNIISDSSKINTNKPFENDLEYIKIFNELGYSINSFTLTELVPLKKIKSVSFFGVSFEEARIRLNSYTNIAILTAGEK